MKCFFPGFIQVLEDILTNNLISWTTLTPEFIEEAIYNFEQLDYAKETEKQNIRNLLYKGLYWTNNSPIY